MNLIGTFYGIGVGPGDPELLTVKAINALKKIDVLIAPKTEKKSDSVALSIAEPYLKPSIEIIFQTFPMVKDFAEETEIFEANKEEILKILRAGKNVGFATLGDPMFYSTYIYVFRLLEKCKNRDDTRRASIFGYCRADWTPAGLWQRYFNDNPGHR